MIDLKDVILGFLERRDMTGYELKGMFSELDFLPWSGNNNQIYTALIELEREGLVEKRRVPQEKLPAQKRYSVTQAGRARLREAVTAPSEAPAVRNDFLLRLAWSECLAKEEVIGMIDEYQRLVETELAMRREKMRRMGAEGARSTREGYVWGMILQNGAMALQCELNWLTQLRNGLANK